MGISEYDTLLVVASRLDGRGMPEVASLVLSVARTLAKLEEKDKVVQTALLESPNRKVKLTFDQDALARLFVAHKDEFVARHGKNQDGYRDGLTILERELEVDRGKPLVTRWGQVGALDSVGFQLDSLLEFLAAIALVFGKITPNEAQVFFELRMSKKGLRFHSTKGSWEESGVTCGHAADLLKHFTNTSTGVGEPIKISNLLKQSFAAKRIIIELQNKQLVATS